MDLVIKDPDGNTIWAGSGVIVEMTKYAKPPPIHFWDNGSYDAIKTMEYDYGTVIQIKSFEKGGPTTSSCGVPGCSVCLPVHKFAYAQGGVVQGPSIGDAVPYIASVGAMFYQEKPQPAPKFEDLTPEEQQQVADILEKSVDVLIRDGWTKNHFHKSKGKKGAPYTYTVVDEPELVVTEEVMNTIGKGVTFCE